jgi:hypothetical protein
MNDAAAIAMINDNCIQVSVYSRVEMLSIGEFAGRFCQPSKIQGES